jgi:predicted nucleic acid-binding protein
MRDRVLIDTSVWIEYLQGTATEELQQLVDDLLSGKEIIVPRIVLAELVQGARSEKDEGERTWMDAGKLSYDLKKKGKTISLADCYISVIAKENRASILTLDKHFKDMQNVAGLELIPV